LKSRYADENLSWIAPLVLLVIATPFLIRGVTFSYRYYLYVLNIAGIYTILAVGLDILSGYTGLISLGHAGFFAIGAYTSAVLVDQAGIPFGLSLIITPIITGFFGLVVGFPALRVSGMYLGLTTMGFGFIARRLIIALRAWTEGSAGLEVSNPVLFGFEFASDWANYFLIFTFVVAVVVVARRVMNSKIGRAFMAIRDSERAAEAVGVNLTRYKLLAFFMSAVLAGLAGVLFAHTMRFISTDHFDILLSIYFIIMILVGGVGSIYGAVLGSVFIVLLDFLLIPAFKDWMALFVAIEVADIQSLIFGLIMFLFIIFQPMGLYGVWLKMRIYWKLFPFNPKKRFT